MNRRMAIVGLDIFILLALPILAGGRPADEPRAARPSPAARATSAAYRARLEDDYVAWLEARLSEAAEQADTPTAPPVEATSLREARRERERLARELDRERKAKADADERADELKQKLADQQEKAEELRDSARGLERQVREAQDMVVELEKRNARLQGKVEAYKDAEAGGHIAGVVEAVRGRVGMVAAELGRLDEDGNLKEAVRTEGMAVPVMFGDRVYLVTSVAALGLTDETFAPDPEARPVNLSHFAAAVLGSDGKPNWVTRLRFFRHEQGLVALETEGPIIPRTPSFRPSPYDFLLHETVIVLSADGSFFEARFAAREGYIQLTAFRTLSLTAPWIRTAQQSPARAGDLVLDHEGNVVAMLVSTTVAYILPRDQRLEDDLVLPAELRDRNSPPRLPEKQRLVAAARELNEWLRVQQVIEQPFRRE